MRQEPAKVSDGRRVPVRTRLGPLTSSGPVRRPPLAAAHVGNSPKSETAKVH